MKKREKGLMLPYALKDMHRYTHTQTHTHTHIRVTDGVTAGPGEDELAVERLKETTQLVVGHDLCVLAV